MLRAHKTIIRPFSMCSVQFINILALTDYLYKISYNSYSLTCFLILLAIPLQCHLIPFTISEVTVLTFMLMCTFMTLRLDRLSNIRWQPSIWQLLGFGSY